MEEQKNHLIDNEFVPYELAVKLKELGFDKPCLSYWDDDKVFELNPEFLKGSEMDSTWLTRPTFSQAFRWFRENHRLSVLIHDCLDDYVGEIVEWSITEIKISHQVPNRIETYEEVELECLKKLIEIVESKEK